MEKFMEAALQEAYEGIEKKSRWSFRCCGSEEWQNRGKRTQPGVV